MKLLIVDDHRLVIDGIRRILEGEPYLIETAENGREAIEKVKSSKPNLVLLDISLPLLNGVDVARWIAKEEPTIRTLMLSMHTDQTFVTEAIQAGASGYVIKHCAAAELVNALREVAMGRAYISPRVADGVLNTLRAPWKKSGKMGGLLSQRQREVLQLIAEGKANKEIAYILHVSVKTVEFHRSAISRELGLRSRAELTQYAIRHGMISGGSV